MKKKGKGLVLSILAAVFSLLSFLGFAFSGITVIFLGYDVKPQSGTFKEWNEMLDGLNETKKAGFGDSNFKTGVTLWNVAKVLLIIVLILAVAVAVFAVLQMFFEHKAIKTAAKVVNIVAIILAIFLPMMQTIGGAFICMESIMGVDGGMMYLMGIGVLVIEICTVLGAAFSLGANKKQKAKKEEA